jgi:hypothetical protein
LCDCDGQSAARRKLVMLQESQRLCRGNVLVNSMLHDAGVAVSDVFVVSARKAEAIERRLCPQVGHVVALPDVEWTKIMASFPSDKTLRRFAAAHRLTVWDQPAQRRPQHCMRASYVSASSRDPLEILAAARLALYLRSNASLAAACKAAVRALWPKRHKVVLADVEANGASMPSATTLERARPRLDCASMLCSRTDFAGRYKRPCPGSRAIFVYTDASPSKGREVFGSILDLYLCGRRECTLVLPGVLLSHGYTTALSKASALLWQLWLVAGPDVCRFRELLEDIPCISADYGTEALLVDCC